MNKIKEIRQSSTEKITIDGTLNFLISSSNRQYLGISVENVEQYVDFLSKKIDENFIENQKKRDKNHHHITIITPNEFAILSLEQKEILEDFLISNLHKSFDLKVQGIGQTKDESNNSSTWFIICNNSKLDSLRGKLSLPKQHYHVTLAFDKADIFIHSKDINSLIYHTNEIIKFPKKQF